MSDNIQIAIVLYPEFTALDLIGPYEVLHNLPGAQVRFLAHEVGPMAADSGALLIGATHTFDETPAPDVVLVPGGPGFTRAARDEVLLSWLRTVAASSSTWMTSVCTGSVILAAAGLLAGSPATSHWIALPSLRLYDATPVADQRIVQVPGTRIATAAGVSAGIDLALWLAARLTDDATAQAVQLAIEYDPQPPFDSGHRSKASTRTVATSTKILMRDSLKPAPLRAATALLWHGALQKIRS